MKKEEQERYLEEYKKEKERGVPFFPDAVFKDAIFALIIFAVIVGLAVFAGASLEEIADPGDSNYTPRPEWYFLFLYELLKYFPGSLEVVGVFVIPVVALGFLIALPWTDRSTKRHWRQRPVVTGITVALLAGSVFLTVAALTAEPPPAAASDLGDQTAKLYAQNCAGCHGSTVAVNPGDDLFLAIKSGTHDGMPAWNADLSDSEIDALVGFILAPDGHDVYLDNCSGCHVLQSLTDADAIDLRAALDEGVSYPPHADLGVPEWSDALSVGEQARLLNFLTAPDGQRLWTQECAACHGQSVVFAGGREELEDVIRSGAGHLEMPAFESSLEPGIVETLARYVTDPPSAPEGPELFGLHCTSCHATRVPSATDLDEARIAIALGGAHEDMPVWGTILTDGQIDALVEYALAASAQPDLNEGQELYSANCASCHGDLGEGGANPTRAGDIIAPISTEEYLTTRDDATLRAIIAQGQPNFGMSPFSEAFGGPLSDEEVDVLVDFMRAWEANPPVELPPDVPVTPPGGGASAASLWRNLCSSCHGISGEGGIGPALNTVWQESVSDNEIFDAINLGHPATAMIAWGEVLTSLQIEELVEHIRDLPGVPTEATAPTYEGAIQGVFDAYCTMCHGTAGDWAASPYAEAIAGGMVIPGDPDNSPLVQSLIGTHPNGVVMPPSVTMSPADIQLIIEWVEAGVPER
ncbi:MAG: c-type cytochrome [Acidimicrobiia bacterium]|nr:c-type cytochrome [Acidimicrobiia bacterium]